MPSKGKKYWGNGEAFRENASMEDQVLMIKVDMEYGQERANLWYFICYGTASPISAW